MSDPVQFNDILALLDNANKSLETEIFVPSLNTSFTAKALNANHTKNIVKTTVEGPFADNQFTIIMHTILSDIFANRIDLKTINLWDKLLILLQLRSKNIKDEAKLTFISEENKQVEKSISLAKHIDKLKKNLPTFANETIHIGVDENSKYDFVLNFPSVTEEFTFENQLYQNKLSKIAEDDVKQMKELIAPIFLSRTAPFIKSIIINDNTIDLVSRSVSERIAIVERLPSKAILTILNKIDEVYGKALQEATKVTKTIDGVSYTAQIKIDASFFIG